MSSDENMALVPALGGLSAEMSVEELEAASLRGVRVGMWANRYSGRALNLIKAKLGYGKFGPWLKDHYCPAHDVSYSAANDWMLLDRILDEVLAYDPAVTSFATAERIWREVLRPKIAGQATVTSSEGTNAVDILDAAVGQAQISVSPRNLEGAAALRPGTSLKGKGTGVYELTAYFTERDRQAYPFYAPSKAEASSAQAAAEKVVRHWLKRRAEERREEPYRGPIKFSECTTSLDPLPVYQPYRQVERRGDVDPTQEPPPWPAIPSEALRKRLEDRRGLDYLPEERTRAERNIQNRLRARQRAGDADAVAKLQEELVDLPARLKREHREALAELRQELDKAERMEAARLRWRERVTVERDWRAGEWIPCAYRFHIRGPIPPEQAGDPAAILPARPSKSQAEGDEG